MLENLKSNAVEWLYDASKQVKSALGRFTPLLVFLFTCAALLYLASPWERFLAVVAVVSGVLTVADVAAFRFGPPSKPSLS